MNSADYEALARLDLPLWVARSAVPAEVESAAGSQQDNGIKLVAGKTDAPLLVLADWEEDQLVLDPSHAAGAMLERILSALDVAPSDYCVLQKSHERFNKSELPDLGAYRWIFVFGDIEIGPIDHDAPVVTVNSLWEMLNNAGAKAPTWAKLKAYKGQISR